MLQSGLSNSTKSSSTFLIALLFFRIKMNTERRLMHTKLTDSGRERGGTRLILNIKGLVRGETNAWPTIQHIVVA